ncbi:MAG: hypothetical protein IBX69_02145 [Anaerolineales bacterium]|nr:hypothetical protein [Anaerolineales bacterium]
MGWALVCLDRFFTEWARLMGDPIKNYYPHGLRYL